MTFVRSKETGEVFAVKTLIVPPRADTDSIQRQFVSEVLALCELRHPCIVNLKGCSLPAGKNEGPKILMEIARGGTLKTLLTSDATHPEWWDATRKVIVILELILGMEFIHSKGFIHRDIKPTNILLDGDHNVKISDFGSSRIYEVDMTMTKNVGTPLYMAREAAEKTFDSKIDVYSFGLILYEIITGTGALTSCENKLKLFLDLAEGKRPDIPRTVLPFARQLIERCWSASPTERPSFSEMLGLLKDAKFEIIPGVDQAAVERFITMIERW
jgi:serine/threonine protein kinase